MNSYLFRSFRPVQSFEPGQVDRFRAVRGLAGLTAAVGLVCGIFGSLRDAQAGQAAPVMSIFQGTPAQSSGVTLASWGSGSITEDQRNIYSGSESLRIVTHGQFQGASLRLNKPVDLGRFVADKSAYLQLALLLPGTGDKMTSGFGSPGKPGFGGGPGFGSPGFPGSSGSPGSGGPMGASASGGTGKLKAIENIRMVLLRPTGKAVEVTLPLSTAVIDNNWKLLSIPVSAIPGVGASNASFSEIRLFGDNAGIMYVGRIGVVLDSTPIKLTQPSDMIVELGKAFRYPASATSGATPLKYSWDWDATDGIQEESTGRSVVHTYYNMGPNNGDFIATVTVSDLYGVKAPVSAKFKVHVHP